MKRIRVTVTAEDITKGVPLEADACPLALAIHRCGFSAASVGVTSWHPDKHGNGEDAMPLTAAASRFLRAFDDGRPVKPATFLLPAPE